ncbi:hypothetical protein [Candidatus Anaplasma sp. TIGMIC]|uniref:hypothetical protein n=1 Tax=Candidatus Anaplasma sp. TIGMIC TaxID=3020713 RepID=UPI00232F6627|nr:hypothetical protein [Candidatus Anaplasma sp. TIGMIC]MDB1135501.1 hypothetical protein [Candidatus Anaplasma sp. TIGMIC]
MTFNNPVESIEGALSRQDRSFLSPLLLMSADEIIEARSGSDTVLSLLVSALFIPAEDQSQMMYSTIYRAFENLYNSVLSGLFSVRDSMLERVLKKTGYMCSLPANTSTQKEKSETACKDGYVPNELVSAVADGIGVVAGKIEDARKVAKESGEEAHEAHKARVSDYLQMENVIYTFDGVEYRKSSLHALILQYLFSTRNPERQLAMLEPVRRFLLGFSEYGLDARGAQSVHYALSMCGGTHEEKFLDEIVRPLLARAHGKLCLSGNNPDVMCDADNNTLMHYAASSVYGSGQAVGEVIKVLGFRELPGLGGDGMSIAELFINNVPYYALFYSLAGRSRADMKRLAEVNRSMRAALTRGDIADLRQASSTRREMFCGTHAQISEFRNNFSKTLCLLLYADEKIRASVTQGVLGPYVRFMVPEILLDIKKSARMICAGADAVSNEHDSILAQRVQEVFDNCDRRHKRLGAQIVASDVARAVLHDPGYIRRLGITAAYTANLHNLGTDSADDNSLVWKYDRYTQSVNGFLGALSGLCKSSCRAYQSLSELYESTRVALELCRKNKESHERWIKVSMAIICCVAPLALLSWNILFLMRGMATSGYPIMRTCVVNAGIVIFTLIFYALFEYLHRALRETELDIARLSGNFTKCVNEYLSVIREALPLLEDHSTLHAQVHESASVTTAKTVAPTAAPSLNESQQQDNDPAVLDSISLDPIGAQLVEAAGTWVSRNAHSLGV